MVLTMGLRREDKNRWERRTPLIPKHIKELKEKHGIQTFIQPSKIRVFSEKEYLDAGAQTSDDLSPCSVVFAVKEIPVDFFEKGKTYVFFAHVIKGQKHNIPMLKKMMELGCNLIDYEKIVDKNGKRLVFFGRYAGIAGMVDTLWVFGQRLKWEHIDSPFSKIKQTLSYKNLDDIRRHLTDVGKEINKKGLAKPITPMVIGLTGYGNVSKGAQEILDMLPVQNVEPDELESVYRNPSNKVIYKVVFKEEHMVEPINSSKGFDLQDYYNNPENYRPVFERYVPYLSVLVNCIFWSSRYPRLITKKYIKNAFKDKLRLKVVGDISADVNGAIEFTEKNTSPDNPVFVYNPFIDKIQDGFTGEGVVVMAVDNLPCELPVESSESFSEALLPFVPAIMEADYDVSDFDKLVLPPEIKNAVILYHGKLTPNYSYINKFL
ncbi:MAG: bifunctional lysine ketoglutarate reductase /saccharopine dehydrogenase family protein [Candidatus Thermoplasmatota archaeon]|nr:bifunctional lysine ketoglutarate reductase /saccharopine dehydrogenase family protein [Candidatus Thermoplasmatota archaeon]